MPFSRPDSDTPFRILVLGNFGAAAAASPRPVLVDRDNVDQVMKRLDVRLELPGAGLLRFRELEDFHPDRLFQSLDLFRGMRDLRANVANPETFGDTALELLSAAKSTQRPAEPNIDAAAVALSSGSLLDDIVGAAESSSGLAAAPARRSDPLQKYINDAVTPYIVARADPKQADMVAQVDSAIAAQMRALLHESRFQALEATWRALDFLVRRTDTDTDLKIYLLHLPKRALAEDLLPATDLRNTTLYRVLVEETVGTPGAEPWAVVAANYTLGPGNEDVELAGRIALLGAAAGCPMIARADAALLGGAEELAAFSELQSIPEARYLGLALPGFLLRLPYGKETSPTELFPLEEMPGEPKHSEYLWGNPAVACAALMAEGFSESGWDMQPGDALDISDLPAHVYKKDGESVIKPCAEVVMTESQATALMERGLMPLLSMKGSDRVHVAGFRSIAGTPLAGRWS
jgi:type VI secretion system protein ImpC